jgi:predicted transposase/invertase (TIGR01784 family)
VAYTLPYENILVKFWAGLSMEEQIMLEMEWNLEDALAVRFREGEESGVQKGLQKGLQKGRQARDEEIVQNALAKGFSLDDISNLTGMDKEAIKRLAKPSNKRGR